MKKIILVSLLSLLLLSASVSADLRNNERGFMVLHYPFYIYTDANDRMNNFYPAGWMGDIRDLQIDYQYAENPKSGKTSIKVRYKNNVKHGANWAGLHFQQTPQNWWSSKRGGYDLTTAKRLYFYARGEHGNEVVEFKTARVRQHTYDHVPKTTIRVKLSKEWKRFELDLSDITLDDIAGGFSFTVSKRDNPKGCVFYIDEIYYTDEIISKKMTAVNTKKEMVD